MSTKELNTLKEKYIQVGDWVRLPYRGGKREGHVKKIAMSPDETPHPPKVAPTLDYPRESSQADAPMHGSCESDKLTAAAITATGDFRRPARQGGRAQSQHPQCREEGR